MNDLKEKIEKIGFAYTPNGRIAYEFTDEKITEILSLFKQATDEERERIRKIILDNMSFYETGMEMGEKLLEYLKTK